MESSNHPQFDQQQLQNQQPSLGLLRFRSDSRSLIGNFTDSGGDKDRFESERLVLRFMNTGSEVGDKSLVSEAEAAPTFPNLRRSFSGLPPHYPRQSSTASSSAMDNNSSYEFLPMDHHGQGKSVSSSLLRQNSSPPGLFANLSVQNGYSNTKVVGNYGGLNGSNADVSPVSNRMKNQISFSSRLPSSLGMLSQISETDAEGVSRPDDDGKLRSSNFDSQYNSSSFSYGPWNDSSHLLQNFPSMKREHDDDGKLFPSGQSGGIGDRVHRLSHHLSLPTTSTELVAMEKFLQFQDSVPCKIRAKRGCATHPRSIAERVRRTRISERMRKLQELVPNMDKQTNTTDMLDLAAEYIKDLQRQFKALSDSRAKCRCSNMQKPINSQLV